MPNVVSVYVADQRQDIG